MENLNLIGLDIEKSAKLTQKLNTLLANFQVFYQNLRGVHWNIKGEHFFELHTKFEELYTDAQEKIDEIAERILTLGGQPLHSFSDYIQEASVKEGKNISSAKEAVNLVLEGLEVIITLERKILEEAAELQDEGSSSLISDYIMNQEKTVWMLSAWLNK